MKDIDIKKLIIALLPLALFFYLASKAGQAFRLAPGADMSARVLNLGGGFSAAFANPLQSLHGAATTWILCRPTSIPTAMKRKSC
jgi:type IV secretion system protein VirD4